MVVGRMGLYVVKILQNTNTIKGWSLLCKIYSIHTIRFVSFPIRISSSPLEFVLKTDDTYWKICTPFPLDYHCHSMSPYLKRMVRVLENKHIPEN